MNPELGSKKILVLAIDDVSIRSKAKLAAKKIRVALR
jgi:hypothetical protein